MDPEQRAAVRESARYLRNVRPLDPDEIAEYVPDQPHPAAVRQVLREGAPDLGLVERDDGTFVPVESGTIDPPPVPVDRLPEPHARRVEDALVARYGPGWHAGESGEELRTSIRSFKASYLAGESIDYDATMALGYAVYHLPAYYATLQYLVADLARDDLIPRRLRVLDVGAGVGGPALGILDTMSDDALVAYEAIEPSAAAADLLDRFLDGTGRNVHATIHRTTAEAFASDRGFDAGAVTAVPDGADGDAANGSAATGDRPNATEPGGAGSQYNLICFANVLSELDDPVDTARRYAAALAPHGSLLAVAPADRETSLGLRRVERGLADAGPTADALTVHSPTVRLWPGERPTDECWAFDVKPDLAVPPFQKRLDDGTGTFVNVDVQYSHFVVRRDGRRRIDRTPSRSRWSRMADSDDSVTDRVNLIGAKLSHSLATTGGGADGGTAGGDGGPPRADAHPGPPAERPPDAPNPVYRVSDGSEAVGHFAVLVDETSLNRDLREAPYGALLGFERALLLWNDDEAAYNLVVDGETVVERLG